MAVYLSKMAATMIGTILEYSVLHTKFQVISFSVQEKMLKVFLSIYQHGGHLGHVTNHLHSPSFFHPMKAPH